MLFGFQVSTAMCGVVRAPAGPSRFRVEWEVVNAEVRACGCVWIRKEGEMKEMRKKRKQARNGNKKEKMKFIVS